MTSCSVHPSVLFAATMASRVVGSLWQILRAYGLGELRLDNPNAYMVRKCLHKMYFHFKPEFWYWKIGIMIRKFLIVFAGE